MRRHGFLAVAAACGVACCAWMINQADQLDASEEPVGSFREVFSVRNDPAPQEDDSGVRLNFFETSWDKVLENVADQADLTLVMDRIPSGRYARRDRTRYDIPSVIRILNTELEPQGFRLFQQGRFLVALKLDAVRSRYARPVAQEEPATTPTHQERSPFRTASQVSQQQQTAPQQENENPVEAFGSTVTPAAPEPQDAASVQPAEPELPPVTTTVAIKQANAMDVARSIYLVFESRTELVKNGLKNLPTFTVYANEEHGADESPLFRIAINNTDNALIIEASPARTKHLSNLVTVLDRKKADETVRLLPNNGVTDATAEDLNNQIRRMVRMQAKDEDVPAQPEEGGTLSLRGEVNVQAMQDLGILILKGNEADVQKVSAIIAQLEEMSVGSLPDIHLLFVQNVNSEALSELLTDVYTQLTTLRARGGNERQIAAFIPVVQPNAVLILAPAIELDSILDLADKLDKEFDPDAEFKVFGLRNAVASQVVTAVESFYQERGGLGTRLRIAADVRTNAVIVQGRKNDLTEVAKVIEKMDVDEPHAVHRVEVVKLKNATAEELATTINSAILGVTSPPSQNNQGGGFGGGFGAGNQGAQELQDSKSVALEFLATSAAGRELLRSGILVDVRVNADIRSNTLIVSAPEVSMPLLKALIAELDKAPGATAEIKVFALRNADASASVDLLTAMFEDQNQEDQLGVQIAGTEGSASSLIPVTFAADTRTNTVLAVGGPEALSVVEAILLRLDSTQARERITRVIRLENAPVEGVATALETWLEAKQELADSTEDLISDIERMRQEVIVTPDLNRNNLIIETSPEYLSQIEAVIADLDARPPQIIVQALIVEVQLNNTDEFGVELGFQDPTLFSRSILESTADLITTTNVVQQPNGQQLQETIIQSQDTTPGLNFNNTLAPLGNNGAINPGRVGTQGLSNFSLGRQNGDLGFGGFVFSAQSDAVSVLLRALAARRQLQVLSRPQIRVMDQNTGKIQVGQVVPVVDGVTITENFANPTVNPRDVGIVLEVTPRVTSDGTIVMEVFAEKSGVLPGGVPIFTDAASGNVVESVVIETAQADTIVSVPNGQTIVIGGMITKSDETLERKVPWLGDLPLLGNLFRYDGTSTVRTELLVFLTPRVIYSDADSELIKQVETERMHFLESEVEEIHGPIYSIPPSHMDDPGMGLSEENILSPSPAPGEEGAIEEGEDGSAVALPPQSRRGTPTIEPRRSGRSIPARTASASRDLDEDEDDRSDNSSEKTDSKETAEKKPWWKIF